MHIQGRTIVSIFILIALLGQPSLALAQNQRYNPNATIQGNGGTFGGITFSGVGAAILGCTNVGGGLSSLISKGTSSLAGLFKSNPSSRLSGTNTPQTGASQTSQNINSSASSPASSISVSGNTKNALGVSADQSVPVNDDKSKKELEKANQRENCLNGIAYAVAKDLLRQVTNKTLNWINTGFGGNPLYIRDIDSFLTTITDEHIDRFLQDIPNKNPIFGNAIRSLVTQQVTGIRDGYVDRIMDTPEARAYQEFQDDFTSGGWDAFLNPRNNVVDSVFDAAQDLAVQIENDQQNAKDELQRNGGFLDMKACIEFEDTSKLQRFVDQCNTSTAANCSTGAYQDAINRISNPKCIKYETVTPGSVISAQAAEVTTSNIRQLEQADAINEVLGAFFDQLLNRLFAFGFKNIGDRGNNQWSFGGFGNNVVLGSNGQPLSSINTGALGYQTGGGPYDLSDFDISRPQHLRAVLQTQYDYLNHSLDAHIALNRILPLAGALDYCMPGPNPTWQDGLADNAQTYFGSLQVVQKNSSTFSQILQSIPVLGALGSLFGNNDPDTIAAVNVQFSDKTTGQLVPISNTVFHARNHSVEYIGNNVQWRYDEVINYYKENYTKDKIKSAFLAVDPANSAYVSGFIDDAYDEMEQLPNYSAALLQAELEGTYKQTEENTRDAIAELERIRTEVNSIVAVAKARYINEQAAAGTPIDQACIDNAYKIDTSPIVPAPRAESDTPSPFVAPSVEANTYFYSQL